MRIVSEINRARESSSTAPGEPELESSGVSLADAGRIVAALAATQPVLLLAAPGVGKSDIVRRAASDAGLACRSLLGTQIAPEDVSGIPRIVGERSVFCPPRVLLPEDNRPFCLFLDELPAAAPDVQKALYALLLERRIGEHALPPGTWVVAAGNRVEDNSMVSSISAALINRVVVLHVRADVTDWLAWAKTERVRPELMAFVACSPDALSRPPGDEAAPFSTPRAWASFSKSLDAAQAASALTPEVRRALAFGLLSARDAAGLCAVVTEGELGKPEWYVMHPERLPIEGARRWLVLEALRNLVQAGRLRCSAAKVESFLLGLPLEQRIAVLIGAVDAWRRAGASNSLEQIITQVTS